MRLFKNINLFFILITNIITLSVEAETLSMTVSGGMSYGVNLQCTAYLHKPDTIQQNNNLPIYFYEQGSGLYSMSTFNGGGDEAYSLSLDKPGISPDPNDSSKVIVHRELFDYYTMDTLTECAKNALIWAIDSLKDPNKVVILHGHSEGSVIMTKLTYEILSNSFPQNSQIQLKALFLSGVVIDSIENIMRTHQLNSSDYKTYMENYNNGNYTQAEDDFFYNNYQIGWYWVDNALNNSYIPLKQVFENISKLENGRTLPIEIFQGLNDLSVPSKSVLELENINNQKQENEKLNLFARYYNSDHELNSTAFSDLRNTMESIINLNTK